MNPTEYREALAALGLTQVGGAKFLGVDPRTSRHWASGDRKVPEPVSIFLRYLIAAKVTPAEVMRILATS
jgi:hypothetical protein